MVTPPNPVILRWSGRPTRGDADAVLRELVSLTGRYELSPGARRVTNATYLDTVDRRLRRRGLVLTHERTSRQPGALVLTGDGAVHTERLAEPPAWPALVGALPEGPVREKVARAMWVRAVAPVARSRAVSREIAVLNGDGKTVLRLDWVETAGVEPAATPPVVEVLLRPLLGYQRDADRVARKLAGAGFDPASGTPADELLGTEDGDGRPALTADMPADVAIATALLGFADAIRANLDGTIDDVDTEFLHDLRVAVRRTRSLIKLTGDVLPPRLADRYAPGFKWLGDLTTPTRDLDVYLLEYDELAAALTAGEPGDLEPFGDFLRRHRDRERRKLVRGLRSQRFERLLSGWEAALTSVSAATESEISTRDGMPAAAGLAAERLRHTARRVTKLARTITPESPAEQVHTLRKRCKELRYLLEVFGPLCAADAHRAAVKDLRRLQDILGEFQDGEVQSAALRTFAQQMLDAGRVPAATLLAMGELSARFAAQQRRARHELTDGLRRYLDHQRIEALLP